ncbi:MAG: helix-turn-helix domain-containing protein [Alphaproteobacteria bacterium]|nr:helix-turn-helix domain-containing protein [Alphaproteobacteria bacterium]
METTNQPTANWQNFEKRPVWCTVTSRELSEILGVSLQTINNWKMRSILPECEPSENHKGNVNRYKISKIRAWLEGKSSDQVEWEWIDKFIKPEPPFTDLEQAYYVVGVCHNVYGVEKPLF